MTKCSPILKIMTKSDPNAILHSLFYFIIGERSLDPSCFWLAGAKATCFWSILPEPFFNGRYGYFPKPGP